MSDKIVIDVSESDRKLSLDLTDKQRQGLEHARAHHPKPHMREKAAALLKVADNWSAQDVAKHGLLSERRANTVRDWVHCYKENGFEALEISEGRGRKPAFFP